MDLLLERTDPQLVDWQMDIFWTVHGGADPARYLNEAAGRVTSAYGHFLALVRVRSNRLLDDVAVAIGRVACKGDVFLVDGAGFELSCQMQVSRVGFGNQDYATGVTVQAVDDARTRDATDAAERLKMIRQCAG